MDIIQKLILLEFFIRVTLMKVFELDNLGFYISNL